MARERWGTRWGVILAVAGSAVGIGNFLRFPGYAASYGGGAFMIPYFVALLLVGLPLVWMEWTLGRYGGSLGHGTGPGILEAVSGRRGARYLGVIGVFGPFAILVYYTFIEAWCLGFSWASITGVVRDHATPEKLSGYFSEFVGLKGGGKTADLTLVWPFVAITVAANLWVILRGVRGGIEKLCRIGMPLLFLLAVFLLVRSATMGTGREGRTWLEGMGYLWKPDFTKLASFEVWLKATGQIFFTLSVGIGVILTYASYMKREDDVAGSGLAAAGTNEFAEVILAGSIVIPVAFMFYGGPQTTEIAKGGIFGLGFVSLPLAFEAMPWGSVLCAAWFFLLFVAALTSSVSLAQPCVAFLEDELGWSRRKATAVLAAAYAGLLVPLCLYWARGWVDEFDLWAGNVLLVVFGLVETIFFAWVLGIDRAWAELHAGARLRVPRFFRFVMKWVSPAFLLVVLGGFVWTTWLEQIRLDGVGEADVGPHWVARGVLVALFLAICALAWRGARRRRTP